MGRESIGGVTEWEPGPDTDWAYGMALDFLTEALGRPPGTSKISVVWQDHDYGSYPSLAVIWDEFSEEPWDYIRRAEDALLEFNAAIDWHRIRPSRFSEGYTVEDEA